jgi:rhamnose transport system substrate-binding protein
MHALATGQITAEAGQTFEAGKLGEYTIEEDADGGLSVLLGTPFVFNADNIDDFDF